MTERCQVCGRDTTRLVSIFRQERSGVWKSRYACPDCERAWLQSFRQPERPQPEAEPPEIDRAQLALFEYGTC